MITYLAVSPGYTASRAQIVSALWPDVDEAAGRHSLASVLWRMKGAFKGSALPVEAEAEEVSLSLGRGNWIDALAFQRRTSKLLKGEVPQTRSAYAKCSRAIEAYAGDLGAGIDAEWLIIDRERVRSMYLDSLYSLANAAAASSQWTAVIWTCKRLCAEEPLREDSHRLLMEAYAKSGNRALAIGQYRKCRAILAKELEVEPMVETTQLYVGLLQGGSSDAALNPPPTSDVRAAIRAARNTVGEALNILESTLERL